MNSLLKKTARELAVNLSSYHFEKHARNAIINQFRYTSRDVKLAWNRFIYGHKDTSLNSVIGLINPFIFGSGTGGDIGGWKELGRTTLGGAADSINVSSLSNKRLYMVLTHIIGSGHAEEWIRFNSDSGNNYSYRRQSNGGSDGTETNVPRIGLSSGVDVDPTGFSIAYIGNYSTKEKLVMAHWVGEKSSGAGNAPHRNESVGKWVNTSNPISAVNIINNGSGDFATNSECVVLGLDPADTHTDNFWGQLFTPVDLGANGTVGSGTFTAKKYIRLMGYIKPTGSVAIGINSNNDSSSNNANYRLNLDGATETTGVNDKQIQLTGSAVSSPIFFDSFIINVSSKEKLFINHVVSRGSVGAGYAPNRIESVGKYVSTSAAITEFRIWDSNWNFITCGAGSQLAGWGND